jgi:hypothetical protein
MTSDKDDGRDFEDDGWAFEVIAPTLQSMLKEFLTPAERVNRLHYMDLAEASWYSKSQAYRVIWRDHVVAALKAFHEISFQKNPKFFEVFDELFTGPPENWTGQIYTAGELMADAHQFWKNANWRFGRTKFTDSQLLDSLYKETACSEMMAVCKLYEYRWTEDGFPLVKISPQFAAASMCTSLDDDVLRELRSPWRAFNIEMPVEEILYQKDAKNVPMKVAHIQVYYGENVIEPSRKWSLSLRSGEKAVYNQRTWMTNEELCSPQEPGDDSSLPWKELGEWDSQSLMLAGRITASVICALTEPKHVCQVSPRRHEAWEKRSVAPANGENLEARIFQLTTPVTIDLIREVREYQMRTRHRKGWKLMIQSVVGGHRKMQPYGPRHSQRKQIWIEPYHRGHPNAPVAVRAHVIKDSK